MTEYLDDIDAIIGTAVVEALIEDSRFYANIGLFKSPNGIWMLDISDYNQDGKLVRDVTDLIIRVDDLKG